MSRSNKNSKAGNRKRVSFFRSVNSTLKREQAISDESSTSNENKNFHFKQQLNDQIRNWALEYRITNRALDALLKILNSIGLSCVLDSRTLLKTPRSVEILEMNGGKFWYNSIIKNLSLIFSNLNEDITIKLNFNIDGLPLFKSSKVQLWPILANIHGRYFIF